MPRHLLRQLPIAKANSEGCGLLNSPGGGMGTLVFIVRRLLGESGISLSGSLMVSTVSGLEIMISST